MLLKDYVDRLIITGNLCEFDVRSMSKIYFIHSNICMFWIDANGRYSLYLGIDGVLYGDPNQTDNALVDYIREQYGSPVFEDVLEIAINNVQSVLVLNFDHELHGLGPAFSAPSDDLTYIRSAVSRVWSNKSGTKYYYPTDEGTTYVYNLDLPNPSPQLVEIDVPKLSDNARLFPLTGFISVGIERDPVIQKIISRTE